MADSEFQADGAIKLNQSSPKDLKLRFGIFYESLSALLDAAWVCKNSEIVLRFCRLHIVYTTPSLAFDLGIFMTIPREWSTQTSLFL